MNKIVRNSLQVFALLGFAVAGAAHGQQTPRNLSYTLPLSDGGSVYIARSDSKNDDLKELVITFTSATGIVSSVKGTLGRGEFADYGIESLSRDKEVDLFGQCPNLVPAKFFGTIRWTWPENGVDTIRLSLDDREPRTLVVCGSELEFCASQSSVDEFNVSAKGLSPAAADEYSPGICFPDTPTGNTITVGDLEVQVPPDFIGEVPAPPVLSDDACSAVYATACKEPLIANQNLILFDIAGNGERGGLGSVLGRQRRALSRALRSGNVAKIDSTIKSVVKTLRSTLVASSVSADLQASLSKIAKVLRAKKNGSRAAVKNAVRQIRKLEGK